MSEQKIKSPRSTWRTVGKKGVCVGGRWYQSRAFSGYCGVDVEIVKEPEAPDWILGCRLGDTYHELSPFVSR